MDSNPKKSLLRASGIAVLLLLLSIAVVSIKGCTGRSGNGGGGSNDIGPAPGPQVSSLYGIMETAGVFDVVVNGSASVTPVSGITLVGLNIVPSWDGTALNLAVTISNTSGADLKGIVLRFGYLEAGRLENNDGYNFGDIPANGAVSRNDIRVNDASSGFSFKAFVTQKRPPAERAVLSEGTAGGASLAKAGQGKAVASGHRDRMRAIAPPHAFAPTGVVSEGAFSSVKTDAAGNPKVSYMQVDTKDLLYAYWEPTADIWVKDIAVDSSGSAGFYSSLALTDLGNPRISYYSSEGSSGEVTGDLRYAYCNSDCGSASSWGYVTIDSTGDVGGHTSLALDNLDYPHIAYYDWTNGDLKYAFCDSALAPTADNCNDAANWTVVTLDSAGYTGLYASIALDPSSYTPRISYYDFTNGDLRYAYCDADCGNPSNWIKFTINSSGDVGGYTSMALDSTTGNPRISYYDFTNMDLKFAYTGSLAGANLGGRNLLGTGLSASNQALAPEILKKPDNTYRMYYQFQ